MLSALVKLSLFPAVLCVRVSLAVLCFVIHHIPPIHWCVTKLFYYLDTVLFTWAQYLDTSDGSRFLTGNYTPVDSEGHFPNLAVTHGAIPLQLSGYYVRNGPNPKYKPSGSYHWFDGDGMLHGILLHAGRVSYTNHWVRTHKLQLEESLGLGRGEVVQLGNLRGVPGLLLIASGALKETLQLRPKSPGRSYGTANTAVVYHAGQLMALQEQDLPYVVHVLLDGHLETVGLQSYGGKLAHPCSAHARVDPETREMIVPGYSPVKKPYFQVSFVSPEGQLERTVPFGKSWPKAKMVHDCGLTQQYVVLLDLPLCFKLESLMRVTKTRNAFVFDPRVQARIGLLPRDAEHEDDALWFNIPACFVFHLANCWETPDTNEVVVVGVRYEHIDLDGLSASPNRTTRDGSADGVLYEWRLDLDTMAVRERPLTSFACEFPGVNPSYSTAPTQYAYAATFADATSTLALSGVAKVDLRTGETVGRIEHDGLGGEVSFVPGDGDDEDDGFLLTYVFNKREQQSYFTVYDAKTMSSEPVASVRLPRRVPFGFHGTWMSEAELRDQRV